MPMNPRLLRPRATGYTPTDADARAYIAAVEAADGSKLENKTRKAIDDFVKGLKSDSIWAAVKASCILAGARTLSGALTPLKGSAPTNIGPFVSGDYNRKTGLVSNGTSKYLLANRNNNADPQDSKHVAVYVSSAPTSGASNYPAHIGAGGNGSGACNIGRLNNNSVSLYSRSHAATFDSISGGAATGMIGSSRSSASGYSFRVSGATSAITRSSQAAANAALAVFNDIADTSGFSISNGRLAFYSIGESLDLAALDTRLSTLYTAIGAAIP
jgi:hypothetical protein